MRFRKDLEFYEPAGDGNKTAYVYRGVYYTPRLSGKELTVWKSSICVSCFVQLAFIFCMGRANSAGFLQLYVMLPFLALFFFSGFSFIAALNLFAWKSRMTIRQHSLSYKRLLRGEQISLFFAALLFVAEVIFALISANPAKERWPLLFLLLQSLSSALVLFLLKDNVALPDKIKETALSLQLGKDQLVWRG